MKTVNNDQVQKREGGEREGGFTSHDTLSETNGRGIGGETGERNEVRAPRCAFQSTLTPPPTSEAVFTSTQRVGERRLFTGN